LGSSASSSRAIWSRRARRRFFQPAHQQLVDRRIVHRPVDQRVQVGVLHPQLDQAALGE